MSNLSQHLSPVFKSKSCSERFERMLSWYDAKTNWIEVAPNSALRKLHKRQTKELNSVIESKLSYQEQLKEPIITQSRKDYAEDQLKMYEAHQVLAEDLLSKLIKILK